MLIVVIILQFKKQQRPREETLFGIIIVVKFKQWEKQCSLKELTPVGIFIFVKFSISFLALINLYWIVSVYLSSIFSWHSSFLCLPPQNPQNEVYLISSLSKSLNIFFSFFI